MSQFKESTWFSNQKFRVSLDKVLVSPGFIAVFGWWFNPGQQVELSFESPLVAGSIRADNIFPLPRPDAAKILENEVPPTQLGFLFIEETVHWNNLKSSPLILSVKNGQEILGKRVLRKMPSSPRDEYLTNFIVPKLSPSQAESQLIRKWARSLPDLPYFRLLEIPLDGSDNQFPLDFEDHIAQRPLETHETKGLQALLALLLKYFPKIGYSNLPPNLENGFLQAAITYSQRYEVDADVLEWAITACHHLKKDCEGTRILTYAVLSENRLEAPSVLQLLSRYHQMIGLGNIDPTIRSEAVSTREAAIFLNYLSFSFFYSKNDLAANLYLAAAHRIEPDLPGPIFNLAVQNLDDPNIAKNLKRLSRLNRGYENTDGHFSWPRWRLREWPRFDYQFPQDAEFLRTSQDWPRITLITPSYNQGRYIEDTILSVLNQNYPNLQYLIFDNQSSDETGEILRRYQDRVSRIKIESDHGQSNAINKGLKVAEGEIIGWLNSDDMLAPGALHHVALAFIHSKADVVSGICCEHSDKRIQLVNKPRIENGPVSPDKLGDIFKYWLKGHFFYQPEVFFTRKILEKAGSILDESLHYSMDYDLWCRFAIKGARFQVLDYPVAFFRKHPAQKTANIADTIEEQAQVRNRYFPLTTSLNRSCSLQEKLRRFRSPGLKKVGILSSRINKIFSPHTQSDMEEFSPADWEIHFAGTIADLPFQKYDLIIFLVHLQADTIPLNHIRKVFPNAILCGWFWDNHHHPFENHKVVSLLDTYFAGHANYSAYLQNKNSHYLGHLPLCISQFSHSMAEQFETQIMGKRTNLIFGGFVKYRFFEKRNRFLDEVISIYPHNDITLIEENRIQSGYFGLSESEKFATWVKNKVSLIVPLNGDLSQRVFDALLAGQIPLIPIEISDAEAIFTPEISKTLGVERFSLNNFETLEKAFQKGIHNFDRDGEAGILGRFQYARDHHLFRSRIQVILAKHKEVI